MEVQKKKQQRYGTVASTLVSGSASTWLAEGGETVDELWWYGYCMWSMVTLPRDMRCPGYLNFWGRLIVFGKLMTFKLQTFTFLQNDGVILLHVPFIQIPWRSTRRSRHFRLHRLRQATAGSFRWSNLVVAASHPTAGQDQQCLSIWTWMKLNSKLQSSTLYTIFCAS